MFVFITVVVFMLLIDTFRTLSSIVFILLYWCRFPASWLVGWLGGQIKFSYIYSCELWLKQALVKETSGTSDFIGGDLKKNNFIGGDLL